MGCIRVNPEFRSQIMLCTWRGLSSLRVHGTFQSRVPILELVTGKSPEPADKNVCATTRYAGCTRIIFGFRVYSLSFALEKTRPDYNRYWSSSTLGKLRAQFG